MPKAKGGMLLGIFASLWILDIFLPWCLCLGFLVCRSVVFVCLLFRYGRGHILFSVIYEALESISYRGLFYRIVERS